MTPGEGADPVLLITGASSGIGAATARAAAPTHRLVLAARSEEPLRELVAELGGEERALAVRCDVTEWDEVQALIAAALESFGRIDVVFANAGFGATRGFLEESVEHWRSMVLTNVSSSVAGRRARPGSLYSATKWAATAIGEALRAELRQMHDNHAIRVTLIEPGMTDTPFFDNGAGPGALEDTDIAKAVLFALEQRDGVDVNEILIRPTSQPI